MVLGEERETERENRRARGPGTGIEPWIEVRCRRRPPGRRSLLPDSDSHTSPTNDLFPPERLIVAVLHTPTIFICTQRRFRTIAASSTDPAASTVTIAAPELPSVRQEPAAAQRGIPEAG